jgi:hypothetical protein
MTGRVVDETALRRVLRALAEEEARIETPSRVEAAVMARFDDRQRGRRTVRPRARTLVRGAATIAAGVTLFGAVMLERGIAPVRIDLPRRPTISFDTEAAAVQPTTAERRATPAVERTRPSTTIEPRSSVVLVGGPMASGELVQVVRMRVDRSALSELGIAQTGTTDTVEIDVLVGEDGVARGLRLPL